MPDGIEIFDIDGTLADVSERIHDLQKKPENWKAFSEEWRKIRDQIDRSPV